jgi:hypothetical protein
LELKSDFEDWQEWAVKNKVEMLSTFD